MKSLTRTLSIALAAVSIFGYSSLAQSQDILEYALLVALSAPVLPDTNGLINNACTNEQVKLNGQFDTKVILDQNSDGSFRLRAQVLPRALDGVGLNTGYIYHVVGGGNVLLNATIVDGITTLPTTANLNAHFKVISEGPASNFSVNAHLVFHIQADGTGTAVVDSFDTSCS